MQIRINPLTGFPIALFNYHDFQVKSMMSYRIEV